MPVSNNQHSALGTQHSGDTPLTLDDFSELMDRLGEVAECLGVAVSGGGDSMALFLLTHEWAQQNDKKIHYFIVDHGWHKGSREACEQVLVWLAARGAQAQILDASGGPARESEARERRYFALEDACRELGIHDLLLAHQLEDQTETFIMRLARGSGIDGLCGMRPIVQRRHIRLLRPFLPVPRARLRATCRVYDQRWLEDPANESLDFERVRIRRSMQALAQLGLDISSIPATMGRLSRSRQALDAVAAEWARHHANLHPEGYISLDHVALAQQPDDICSRILSRALLCIGGGDYAPNSEKILALDLTRAQTIAGCQLFVRQQKVLICREANREKAEDVVLQPGRDILWDNRFVLHLSAACTEDLIIRPGLAKNQSDFYSDLPSPIRQRLPVAHASSCMLTPNFTGQEGPLCAVFAPSHPWFD